MLRDKNLFSCCKKVVFSLTLLFFFLFLSLGNMPRLLKTSFFSDHLLLTELFLYLLTFLGLFFINLQKKSWVHLFFLCSGALLSCLYGSCLQGISLHASLYTARLIAFFVASYVLSSICFEKFQGSLVDFFSFLSKTYLVTLLFGFFFYLVFPKASELWTLLNSYNISFHGDPHVGRFVSVYFDPNYYASIAVLPFLTSCFLYQKTQKKWHLFLAILFAISVLLTWSRSGIALFCGLLGFMLIGSGKRLFSKRSLYAFLVLLFSSIALCFLFQEELSSFFYRLFHLFEDDSALYRFQTFKIGLALLKEHPLLGIGYHFLYDFTNLEIGLPSLDSSLLSLLVEIGVLPFLALMVYVGSKMRFLPKAIQRFKNRENSAFLGWFVFGATLTLLFASHFNNVLFYVFWALPFSVTSLYLKNSLKARDSP